MGKIEGIVKNIADICQENKIKYVIVGAVAVSSWGNFRGTCDVDVILSLDEKQLVKLVGAFKRKGFIAETDDAIQALKERSHFTIFDSRSNFHIDAKGIYTENDRETLERRKKVDVGGLVFYVNSPEDLIANKLLFGSEQDIRDAKGVYLRQGKGLNLPYLRTKCKKLGVSRELERMLGELG